MENNRLLRCLIIAVLASLFGGGAAQTEDEVVARYFEQAGDHATIFNGIIEAQFPRAMWVDHPYLDSQDYRKGSVCYDGKVHENVGVRYDIFNNVVSVSTITRDLGMVPDVKRIQWFSIGKKYFVPSGNRFACIEMVGSKLALLHRSAKIKGVDVIRDYKVYGAMISVDSYFIKEGDEYIEVSSLSDIIKHWPAYKKQLKHYAKENELDFRKNKTEAFYYEVRYLDELMGGEEQTQFDIAQFLPAETPKTMPVAQVEHSLTGVEKPDVDLNQEMASVAAFRQGGSGFYDLDDIVDDEEMGIAELEPAKEGHILEEVEVTGFSSKLDAPQMGMEKFRPSMMRNVPLSLGESDVLKMVQTLPGIKTVGEASSGFNVRGGASDQNLIMLNNGMIYNPMHMFGLFSAFNSDMINDAELYKSGIPAQYGGRISSVLNITPKIADKQQWHGSLSLGAVTSKGTLEAPIVKDKVSLLLSGRTTYSDWMLKLVPERTGYSDGEASFYDLGAVLSWTVNRNHRINAYGYMSHDHFGFNAYEKYNYQNRNASLEWKARFNDVLSGSFSAGADHYDYSNEDKSTATVAARLKFAIDQYFARGIFTLELDAPHTVKAGFNSLMYDINPGTYEPMSLMSTVVLDQLDHEKAIELALFAEDEWKLTDALKVNYGVRHNLFKIDSKVFQNPEIRLSANYSFTDQMSAKLGFNTMHQYIHKVSNTAIMSPTDTWKLSDDEIKPQSGWQLAGGWYYEAENKKFEVSAEAYYKQMDNYLTYRSAAKLVMNHHLADDVVATEGRAYGVELQLRKPTGKLNGWISYSYSRTLLRQKDRSVVNVINGGDWFAADYDRPHEVKMVANYKFTHRYSLSVNGDYSTGRPITIPAGQYYDMRVKGMMPYYTERNGYRLPYYMRVDASFNIEPNHHLTQKTHSWFSIGVYNLLGRKNAYSVYYESENGEVKGYQLSIFGAPIPFVSYNIKF